MRKLSFFFSLFILLNGLSARAENYVLFNSSGVPSSGYERMLRSMKIGDTAQFGNGLKFRLGQRLDGGKGSVTAVFELPDHPGRVLRLSKTADSGDRGFLWSMAKGHEVLKKESVPSVEIFDQARPMEYLVVERVPGPLMSAEEFARSAKIPAAARKKMEEALVSFARNSAQFQEIADFTLNQLVWDQKRGRWLLLDWTERHRSAALLDQGRVTGFSPDTIWDDAFDSLLNEDLKPRERTQAKALYDRIDDAVWSHRAGKTQTLPLPDCGKKFGGLPASGR